MYATINLPGSSHFEWHGPDTRDACEQWLQARVAKLQQTELVTSLLPQRILANKVVEAWRYRDGTHVVTHAELHDTEPCCGVKIGRPHLTDCPR